MSLRAFCFTATCLVAFASGALAAPDRVAADAVAKREFLNLNFFAGGRGMHLVPGLIDVFTFLEKTKVGLKSRDEMLARQWGLNVRDHWPVGLFDVEYKETRVGVLGCVACHSGKAAGVFVPGLGNKNIDVLQIGRDAAFVESLYAKIRPAHTDDKEVGESALEFAKLLSDENLGNLTQGLVPVSFIRTWFYKQAGQPRPTDLTRGAVKVPALWGYGEKRKVGQFSDGFGVGTLPGWAIAVELTAGQAPETVRSYLPKVEHAENLLGEFLPPAYPFEIDKTRASRGEKLFAATCSRCHGTYERDENNLPVYKAPKWIPVSVVGTDRDRLASNTDGFRALVESNPLSDILKANAFGEGYFAPRLVGIWARFPYLHNGSVPNVATLLTPPDKRVTSFSLRDAGEYYRFDKESLGLTLASNRESAAKELEDVNETDSAELASADPVTLEWAAMSSRKTGRSDYSTLKTGQSNQGHPFGTNLSSEEKRDVIEYLKTL